MIITCEQCDTRFQFDESRIPVRGLRVRCSRCKHDFAVARPDPGSDPLPETEPEREPESESQIDAPAPDLELGGEASFVDPEPDPDPEPTPDLGPDPDAPESQAVPPRDESNWEFEREPFGFDDHGDLSAARSAVDDLLDAGGGSADETDPWDTDPDFGSGVEQDLGADTPTGLAIDDPNEPAPELGHAPRPPTAPHGEELGSPEEWDFFGSVARETGDAAPAEPSPSPLSTPSAARFPSDPMEPGPVARSARKLGDAVGWIAVVGLVAGISWLTLGTGALDAREASLQPGSHLGVEGRWVDNPLAGRFYVVEGVVPWGQPGTRPVVQLLDEGGNALSDGVPLGIPLASEDLRARPPAEIGEQLASTASALARSASRPGGRRLQAVLPEVPPGAQGFEVRFVPAH